jgi:hypothetical protein
MSGGSWDYLSSKSATEILGDVDTMKAMRDRIVELGIGGNIVFDMNRIVSHLDEAHRLADSSDMRNVWHEVEWHDSGDHSLHSVHQAAWIYNGRKPCSHPSCTEPRWTYMGWQQGDGSYVSGNVYHKYCLECGSRVIIERKVTRR